MKQQAGILLLTLVIATPLAAQENLSARWKETQRLSLKEKPVAFSDTLRLSDVSKESMSLRKGAFQYKGQVSNDVLDFDYTTYHIIKNTRDEIRLSDDEYIHIFSRESKDLSAADAAAKKEGIDLPAEPVRQIDRNLLKGNWEVYKRRGKNGPLPKIDYSTLITRMVVNEAGAGEGTGNLYAGGSDVLYRIKECTGSDIVVLDAKQAAHQLKVWRLSAEELVIEGDDGIIYYMKHFR